MEQQPAAARRSRRREAVPPREQPEADRARDVAPEPPAAAPERPAADRARQFANDTKARAAEAMVQGRRAIGEAKERAAEAIVQARRMADETKARAAEAMVQARRVADETKARAAEALAPALEAASKAQAKVRQVTDQAAAIVDAGYELAPFAPPLVAPALKPSPEQAAAATAAAAKRAFVTDTRFTLGEAAIRSISAVGRVLPYASSVFVVGLSLMSFNKVADCALVVDRKQCLDALARYDKLAAEKMSLVPGEEDVGLDMELRALGDKIKNADNWGGPLRTMVTGDIMAAYVGEVTGLFAFSPVSLANFGCWFEYGFSEDSYAARFSRGVHAVLALPTRTLDAAKAFWESDVLKSGTAAAKMAVAAGTTVYNVLYYLSLIPTVVHAANVWLGEVFAAAYGQLASLGETAAKALGIGIPGFFAFVPTLQLVAKGITLASAMWKLLGPVDMAMRQLVKQMLAPRDMDTTLPYTHWTGPALRAFLLRLPTLLGFLLGQLGGIVDLAKPSHWFWGTGVVALAALAVAKLVGFWLDSMIKPVRDALMSLQEVLLQFDLGSYTPLRFISGVREVQYQPPGIFTRLTQPDAHIWHTQWYHAPWFNPLARRPARPEHVVFASHVLRVMLYQRRPDLVQLLIGAPDNDSLDANMLGHPFVLLITKGTRPGDQEKRQFLWTLPRNVLTEPRYAFAVGVQETALALIDQIESALLCNTARLADRVVEISVGDEHFVLYLADFHILQEKDTEKNRRDRKQTLTSLRDRRYNHPDEPLYLIIERAVQPPPPAPEAQVPAAPEADLAGVPPPADQPAPTQAKPKKKRASKKTAPLVNVPVLFACLNEYLGRLADAEGWHIVAYNDGNQESPFASAAEGFRPVATARPDGSKNGSYFIRDCHAGMQAQRMKLKALTSLQSVAQHIVYEPVPAVPPATAVDLEPEVQLPVAPAAPATPAAAAPAAAPARARKTRAPRKKL